MRFQQKIMTYYLFWIKTNDTYVSGLRDFTILTIVWWSDRPEKHILTWVTQKYTKYRFEREENRLEVYIYTTGLGSTTLRFIYFLHISIIGLINGRIMFILISFNAFTSRMFTLKRVLFYLLLLHDDFDSLLFRSPFELK